jgi:hypothetical protein
LTRLRNQVFALVDAFTEQEEKRRQAKDRIRQETSYFVRDELDPNL